MSETARPNSISPDLKREKTAYHETGHAIPDLSFADIVTNQFQYVAIFPNDERRSAGQDRFLDSKENYHPEHFDFHFEDESKVELAEFSQQELEAPLFVLLAVLGASFEIFPNLRLLKNKANPP